MSQSELLKRAVAILHENNIEYMLTGSMVSSLQGEPRATHDIDIVISIQAKDIKNILNSFPMPPYYVSEENIKEAIKHRSMFNVLDMTEGDKIDFWILSDETYDKIRFGRRIRENIFGMDIYISAPEDTILYKLYWGKTSGGSEKQFGDALRVFEIQYAGLDLPYLHAWAEKLGVADLLERIKQEAEIIG